MTITKRIAFATARQYPDLIDDDRLVVDELRRRGLDVDPVIWDSAEIDYRGYASIVIRSCWDYHYQPDRFLAWIRSVRDRDLPLWNPAGVIEWNLNKNYLRDLHERGVLVPETIWLKTGTEADLSAILAERRWRRAVVKPAISATAFRTFVISPETAAPEQPAFNELLSVSDVLVQRFVDEVLTDGEWSLLFFGGRYSHAVLKQPGDGDFRVQEEFGGRSLAAAPAAHLIEAAARIIGLVDDPLLFARVDGVEIDGRLCLMELELIEPLLFLSLDREAPRRLADAIISCVETRC